MWQNLVFSASAYKVADISVWGKNYIQGIQGGKGILFVSLKGRPFSDKGEEKKIKTHTNRTKSCFFRSLASLVAYGQLLAWMVEKKVSSDFFPLI